MGGKKNPSAGDDVKAHDKSTRQRRSRVYGTIRGDAPYERGCAPIPSSDCTRLPLNYAMNVINGAAAKLAEHVASAKIVLPLRIFFGGTVDTKPAMILIGSGLWTVAAISFAAIKEAPGSTGGGRNILKETLAEWGLFRRQRWFQRFFSARRIFWGSCFSADSIRLYNSRRSADSSIYYHYGSYYALLQYEHIRSWR